MLFWIHGGGYSAGSGQELKSYDGENLARRGDVVVVSVNHRLNSLGYLNLAEHGERWAASGNVGMLDLVASLEWVRDNIGEFGGDRNSVTIFGQSGGNSHHRGVISPDRERASVGAPQSTAGFFRSMRSTPGLRRFPPVCR